LHRARFPAERGSITARFASRPYFSATAGDTPSVAGSGKRRTFGDGVKIRKRSADSGKAGQADADLPDKESGG
jgi:hypothetical protein